MFTKNPYNNQCTSQHKSRCKNRLPSILILFACTFLSFQPVSAYTYVFGDDLNFLRKSDTSHIVLPESDILFYPQAPLANWEKQNESCEEASASLLYRNMYGIPKISPEDFDAELDRLNAFEEFQGIPRNKILTLKSGEDKAYVQDLSIEQVADLLLEQYFHIQQERVFILNHPTIDDMERLLGNNFMLLVPVNTFEVKNIYANHATYHIMPIA